MVSYCAARAGSSSERFDRDGESWLPVIADRRRPLMRCTECSSKLVTRRRRRDIDANHSNAPPRPRASFCASREEIVPLAQPKCLDLLMPLWHLVDFI